ncbi:MAG TPA: arylesterase, partial [Rhodobacter sp.]|nr:arylesterase [Rhodobacter sp.]
DTTAGGLERIDWTLTPDVSAVIIILGGNDLLRGLAPKDTKANLEGIIAKVLAKGLPVLLVPLAAPGNYGPAYQNAFDAIFPSLAQSYNISLATPLLAPLLEHGLAAALKNYMQSDAVHPNPAGVQKVVAALGPQVAAWLTKL